MASSKPLCQKILDQLLNMDAESRELQCKLEINVVPLEVKGSAVLPGEVEGMAKSVDMVCDKLISTLKSIKAEHRKFCDLHLQPERRQQGVRVSNRQDSGFGSACFDPSLETSDLGELAERRRDSSHTTTPIQEEGDSEITFETFGGESEKSTEA